MKNKGILLLMLLMLVALATQAQYLHKPGDKAIDFEGVTVNGKPYHLYDSQAEHIIICFWSVNCELCHDFIDELRTHVDLKHDYELVSFALAQSPKEVKKKARCLRFHGYHFYDPDGWDSQPFLDYDVVTTPTVILLDKDKNIIGEAYDWDEFKELMTHE